jgi:hypothetical protein
MRLALALHARSGRWIPPALLLTVWTALVVANPGSALDNAANLFFAVLAASVWWTSVIGNVDDDPHRDLCAAAVGGPGRVAVVRHVGAFAVTSVAALVVAVLADVSGDGAGPSWVKVVAGTVGLLLSAALLGTAVGGFLHRPLLRSTAWIVVLGLGAVIVVVLLPPVRDVLHDADHGHVGGVGLLLGAALAVAAVAGWSSAVLAARAS